MKTMLQGARDMELAAKALGGEIPKAAVVASAQVVKDATRREMDKIAPSGRFSHVGAKGAKVGVSYSLLGNTALVRATGPWQLVENDTKAHPEMSSGIGRSHGRGKLARYYARQELFQAVFGAAGAFSGAKPLRTPYGPRYRVNIPVIPGRHPWSHGVEKATPVVRETMANSVIGSLRAIFR